MGTTGIGANTDIRLIVEASDWPWLCCGSAAIVGLVPGEALLCEAVLEACMGAAEAADSGVAAAAGQLLGWKHPSPFTVVAEGVVRSGAGPAVIGEFAEQPYPGAMLGPPGRQASSPGY